MRLPRDIAGRDLVKLLGQYGYEVDHQTGSHIRLRRSAASEQHLTIPDHDPIKIGTLSAIMRLVAEQTSITRDDLVKQLFA